MREPRRQLEFVVDTFDQILVKKKRNKKENPSPEEDGEASMSSIYLCIPSMVDSRRTDVSVWDMNLIFVFSLPRACFYFLFFFFASWEQLLPHAL